MNPISTIEQGMRPADVRGHHVSGFGASQFGASQDGTSVQHAPVEYGCVDWYPYAADEQHTEWFDDRAIALA